MAGIIQHFVLLEGKNTDPLAKKTLIFPRYHQLDVVRRLLNHAAGHGVGHSYLIQHSAGSGKSNSITWAAYQLIETYPERIDLQGARALHDYTMALKNQYLRSSAPISKVIYDDRIHVIDNALGHIITASVISAPAAIMLGLIMVPGAEQDIDESPLKIANDYQSVMDAITRGTADGLKLMTNVGAMLLVLVLLRFIKIWQ